MRIWNFGYCVILFLLFLLTIIFITIIYDKFFWGGGAGVDY